MTTSQRLTAMPRAFDPEIGADVSALFADLDPDMRDLIGGAGGSAPYIADLLRREHGWLPIALDDPEAALAQCVQSLTPKSQKETATDLRAAKRQVALLTALMDLGGIWPLETVTAYLSQFAAKACDVALKSALAPLLARGKLRGQGADDIATAGGMCVLAMGKMGAEELNYSSDIDLICLFDQDRFDPDDYMAARKTFIQATRAMTKLLSETTAEGYVFRTDLRLRPDPAVTPVCIAMEAAEQYYESVGRSWERAAYIKANAVAGDITAGQRFLNSLRPFVWRKHLDFAAIEDAQDMQRAIRTHKGISGTITLPGHNMKLGRGGIREIEFFTQTRQLIAGGRDPDLRVRGTVAGLNMLADKDWITADVAAMLGDHYRVHRTVEHRLQMMRDAQTHSLPTTQEGFERLACLMGQDRAALEDMLHKRLTETHHATEDFFARAPDPAPPPVSAWHITPDIAARWLTYPALRSPRARALLDRLTPELDRHLGNAARPDAAFAAFDRFLAGLPAGVQLLSLFEANPHLISLVLDIMTTAPVLADYLSRNASVLDAVIGGGFFAAWPGQTGLQAELGATLAEIGPDYEACLDATRRWMKEYHFRIGVHLLRGLTDAEEAGRQYADLGGAVLTGLWPVVQGEFARKHGPPPGRGAVVLGMGALGAGAMNAASDLDLIVIYDPQSEETSHGARPLAARPYFARLTQMLITALTAPMAQGRLYEVDMRLRPSGNKGPVATSWDGFKAYQQTEAWTWEHLALTRARVIAGPPEFAADIEMFRRTLLARPRNAAHIAKDVADMRARIAAAKPGDHWLDVKTGPGRIQDIELLAQTGALLAGSPTHDIASGLAALGLRDTQLLADTHHMLWCLHLARRLVLPDIARSDEIGPGAATFLAAQAGQTSLADTQKALEHQHPRVAAVISKILDDLQKGTQP
ncbi:MAG: glutamine-synthetase adenylyltransferase [Pseudomonadota bacterium]